MLCYQNLRLIGSLVVTPDSFWNSLCNETMKCDGHAEGHYHRHTKCLSSCLDLKEIDAHYSTFDENFHFENKIFSIIYGSPRNSKTQSTVI